MNTKGSPEKDGPFFRGKDTGVANQISDLIERMDKLISTIEIQTAVMDCLIDAIMQEGGEEEEQVLPRTLDPSDDEGLGVCLGDH